MFPTVHGVVSQGGVTPPPEPVVAGGPAIYHAGSWHTVNTDSNIGWRFTVGANDVTVAALRLYNDQPERTETVTVYRYADGSVVAQAEITASGGWTDKLVPPFVLQAGETYVISSYFGGQTRPLNRHGGQPAIDTSITLVSNMSGSGPSMPTTSSSAANNQYLAASFRAARPPAGHYRFFRIENLDSVNGGRFLGVNTLGFRETINGPDVAVGNVRGTSRANPQGGSTPNNAFNGNTSNGWSDNELGVDNSEKWLMCDFGSGAEIAPVEYLVGAFPSATSTADRSLAKWDLVASNDLETWDTLDQVTGQSGWTLGEVRVFSL